MKTALKVLGIIAIVLGGITLLSILWETSLEEMGYAFVGGGLYLANGIVMVLASKKIKTN